MFTPDIPAGLASLITPWALAFNVVLAAGLMAIGVLTWRRPAVGVAAAAFALPLYLARASVGGLPTTYLELVILLVCGVTLVSALAKKNFRRGAPDPLRWPATALLVAGTAALAWSPDTLAAAGLWRAYLVEPALLYAVARFALQDERDYRRVARALLASALGVALLSIWQQFSGIGIAEPQWVPLAQRRVTAHYTSPNAVGLYLGPIAALAAGLLCIHPRRWRAMAGAGTVLLIALIAILYTRSAGTWIGLFFAAAVVAYFTLGRWKTAGMLTAALALSLLLPAVQHRIRIELTDPASVNRRVLWQGSWDFLTASPKNFVLGTGIHGFPKVQDAFRDPRKMEPLLYPHTIALNFWMEFGLGGLLSAAWLGLAAVRIAVSNLRQRVDGLTLGGLAALAAILAHGLVDVPYFKNDLAALTWLLLAFVIWRGQKNSSAAAEPKP
ncbi:MAG: O-antigen ligase family protein [bacterium]|nr:O-antigen ligase family protein [bacterium]